jgi:flavin-dependent thymidylate synthase
MVKLLPYDPRVDVIWSTPNPTAVVTEAANSTQKGIFTGEVKPSEALIKFLYEAQHGSPLEHAVICFRISQISRACADQLRTHRISSPTMSSTHYQDHRDVPHRVALELIGEAEETVSHTMETYTALIDKGMDKAHVRQILPLSIEVRYMLTINARSLAHLITLRKCYRNTIETILVARKLHFAALTWFPALFKHVNRPCECEMQCHEGKMRCNYHKMHNEVAKYV